MGIWSTEAIPRSCWACSNLASKVSGLPNLREKIAITQAVVSNWNSQQRQTKMRLKLISNKSCVWFNFLNCLMLLTDVKQFKLKISMFWCWDTRIGPQPGHWMVSVFGASMPSVPEPCGRSVSQGTDEKWLQTFPLKNPNWLIVIMIYDVIVIYKKCTSRVFTKNGEVGNSPRPVLLAGGERDRRSCWRFESWPKRDQREGPDLVVPMCDLD